MELKHVDLTKDSIKEMKLLIVPYGIETTDTDAGYQSIGSFNRTLWN